MDLSKREKTGLLVFSLIIITILSVMYYNNKNIPVEITKNEKPAGTGTLETKSGTINVYIRGEVNNPGVYTLQADERVEKLVQMAQGFTQNADLNAINLAKKLRDEEFIVVPSKNNTAILPTGTVSAQPSQGKVNINTATLNELKTLDGIGDTLGQRIIDYRTNNGMFSDIKDLKKVSGIGESRFKAIENKISVY